jgi:hypothetical protein
MAQPQCRANPKTIQTLREITNANGRHAERLIDAMRVFVKAAQSLDSLRTQARSSFM